jgi:hypothetical protein
VPYLPELFEGELFRDFVISFVVNEENREALVVGEIEDKLVLKRMWDEEGERKEDLILEELLWSGIVASQQGLEIGEFHSPPILRVILAPKEIPE